MPMEEVAVYAESRLLEDAIMGPLHEGKSKKKDSEDEDSEEDSGDDEDSDDEDDEDSDDEDSEDEDSDDEDSEDDSEDKGKKKKKAKNEAMSLVEAHAVLTEAGLHDMAEIAEFYSRPGVLREAATPEAMKAKRQALEVRIEAFKDQVKEADKAIREVAANEPDKATKIIRGVMAVFYVLAAALMTFFGLTSGGFIPAFLCGIYVYLCGYLGYWLGLMTIKGEAYAVMAQARPNLQKSLKFIEENGTPAQYKEAKAAMEKLEGKAAAVKH